MFRKFVKLFILLLLAVFTKAMAQHDCSLGGLDSSDDSAVPLSLPQKTLKELYDLFHEDRDKIVEKLEKISDELISVELKIEARGLSQNSRYLDPEWRELKLTLGEGLGGIDHYNQLISLASKFINLSRRVEALGVTPVVLRLSPQEKTTQWVKMALVNELSQMVLLLQSKPVSSELENLQKRELVFRDILYELQNTNVSHRLTQDVIRVLETLSNYYKISR